MRWPRGSCNGLGRCQAPKLPSIGTGTASPLGRTWPLWQVSSFTWWMLTSRRPDQTWYVSNINYFYHDLSLHSNIRQEEVIIIYYIYYVRVDPKSMKFLFVLYSGTFPYHWKEVDVVLSARPGCDGQGRWSVRELTGLQKTGARHELFLIEKLEGMKLKAINGLMYWKKFYYRPLGEFEQVCWCIFYLQEVLAAKIATQSGHSSCNAMKIGYSMKLDKVAIC